MKLTKGARAQQQRAKRREKRLAQEKRVEELEALRDSFPTRLDLHLAIRAAVERVKLDRLRNEWNRLGGPKFTRRLASLEDSCVKRSFAKEARNACRSVFGEPPKRKLIVAHNRADFVSDWERFGDEVLYSWLEIRGVRGVIQSGGSQMQVQTELRVYAWRVENYRMDVEDSTSMCAWLTRSIERIKRGDVKREVEELEKRYGRVMAVRDVSTRIVRVAA